MPNHIPFVSLQYKACDSKTPNVVGGRLEVNAKSFGNFFDRQFWPLLQKIENIYSPMIGEPFNNPLKCA